MDKTQIIKRPVITEKSMADANNGKFTFVVEKQATKPMIKQAIQNAFDVHVVGVTTYIVKGKTQRVGKRRNEVKQTPWKKALVQLKGGEKIALFDLGSK